MRTKSILFRVDASILTGSGHVMRGLTLAEELRNAGAEVGFVARMHEGNLNGLIRSKGFQIFELPVGQQTNIGDGARGVYAQWLGASQQEDARETIEAMGDFRPDWLIIDHYAIDKQWEQLVRPHVSRIMVIDDLADRKHDCDILLDQNYVIGKEDRYKGLVPPSCTTLLGPHYALLRKEFAEAGALMRMRDGIVKRVFVFFGGVDPDNMTCKSLDALLDPELSHLKVDVVLGSANPHRDKVRQLVERRPHTTFHVQVDTVAKLMASADLALCAGGSSTWERLSLGLPSLVVTIADNQAPFTRDLNNDGLLRWLGSSQNVDVVMIKSALKVALMDSERNRQESEAGMLMVDGNGAVRVVQCIQLIS